MTSRPPAPRGSVVRSEEIPAERGAGGASVRTLLDTGSGGRGLVRHQVDMPRLTSHSGTAGGAGEVGVLVAATCPPGGGPRRSGLPHPRRARLVAPRLAVSQ